MNLLRNTFRILIGIVFIFSGFVKGIDPMGTVFRMNDYFTVFGTTWAIPFSLWLTIFLCVLEFSIGVSLLFNWWVRKTAWILLPMMIFFTILTFFDALYNLVPDCGCFGEAIKLTNVQTFIKNLVLMGMVIPVFTWRNKYHGSVKPVAEVVLLSVIAAGFCWLSIYCSLHLPLIDFMGWKTGNQVNKTTALPVQFYVTYKNKNTGEEKEFKAPDYPWNDSVWLSTWIFKRQRVVDPNVNQGLVLRVEDAQGNDYTSSILDNPGYQFILVAYDLEQTNPAGFHKVLPLYKKGMEAGHSFVCLTSTLDPFIRQFRIKNGTAFDYYNADDVVLKTMVRSNPGLVLLHNGKVLAKWAWRDFPDYQTVKTKYIQE
jgi:uncharacterized membrane protein YphA (DoxX/SURF4 family)